uniref:Consortin C-terminal domain-containing protein n=1 Tax=Cyclopterus lumpus TaxID=8103 RepID=A0A8C3AIS8_CYCLU
ELLASLQSLRENSDYTMLPHSLHQIAEAYSLKEDYQWAIQFLQLEKLYHERLLSNLAALQANWGTARICFIPSGNIICEEKPSFNETETTHQDEEQKQSVDPELPTPQTCHQEGGEEEEEEEEEREEEEEEETCEEGQEVEEEEEPCEETPEEEVKVEWPTGVPQASDKDLDKLSHTEGVGKHFIFWSNHLASVHFSPADEMGGDSCLILLLLCLVTVVISIGGTALYCTLVDTYSNICTDFTHNVDFYVMNVRSVNVRVHLNTSGCS